MYGNVNFRQREFPVEFPGEVSALNSFSSTFFMMLLLV